MVHRHKLFRTLNRAAALLALALWLPTGTTLAHGDLDGRIAHISAQISEQPDNVTLRLQRAELHRQHAHFDRALADLNDVARLKPDARIVHLAKARVWNDTGKTTNALAAVEIFLRLEAEHPEALVIRARCRLKLGQAATAIEDFTLALSRLQTPGPDLFLERAHAQAASGQLAKAVSGLDEGMARVGEAPALHLTTIEYERQLANFDAALARVDKLIARQPAKEPWLALRGEILTQAGRLAEAKEAFQQTLAGIESYPPARRNLDLTKQLQARAREGLARVETRLAQANRHASTR